MTDSVLDGLFAQLEGVLDRTLLLVIADRYDELEAGAGEGWWAMHKTNRNPDHYWDNFYPYHWQPLSRSDHSNALPVVWYNAMRDKCCMRDGYFVFGKAAAAYMAAAEAWMAMNKFQRLRALEELK